MNATRARLNLSEDPCRAIVRSRYLTEEYAPRPCIAVDYWNEAGRNQRMRAGPDTQGWPGRTKRMGQSTACLIPMRTVTSASSAGVSSPVPGGAKPGRQDRGHCGSTRKAKRLTEPTRPDVSSLAAAPVGKPRLMAICADPPMAQVHGAARNRPCLHLAGYVRAEVAAIDAYT